MPELSKRFKVEAQRQASAIVRSDHEPDDQDFIDTVSEFAMGRRNEPRRDLDHVQWLGLRAQATAAWVN
jgi:hypothetical protein